MELYCRGLLSYLENQAILKGMPSPSEIEEGECYRVICRIRQILADESLEDSECFMKIEEIVCALQSVGLDAGGRHDFG